MADVDTPTLREYLVLQILGEQALRIQAQEAHAAIHVRESEARDKAALNLQEYKENANQFRTQLADERIRYVAREYYDTQHNALKEEIRRFGDRVGKTEQTLANYDGRLFMFALGLTMVNLIIVVATHFFGK